MNDQFDLLLIGAALVSLHSYKRYNTPQSNRYSTTFLRFHCYFSLYLTITLFTYGAIYVVLRSSGSLRDSLGSFDETLKSTFKMLGDTPPAIAAALLLTTLLPSTPWLSRFDHWILEYMWDLGNIPAYMVRQTEKLRRARILIRPALQEAVTDTARQWELPEQYLQFSPDVTLNYTWTKTCAMLLQVRRYANNLNPHYKRFVDVHNTELERLFLDLQSLTKKIVNCLQLADTDNAQQGQDLRAQRVLTNSLEQRLGQIEKWTAEYVVRMINHAEVTEHKRRSAYLEFGFDDAGETSNQVSPVQMLHLFILLCGGYLALSAIDNLSKGQEIFGGPVFFQTILMVLTYNVAVLSALAFSRIYRHSNPDASGSYAFLVRVAAGLLAVIGWAITAYIVRAVYAGNAFSVAAIMENLRWSYPYALQSFAISFALTWLMDQAYQPTQLGSVAELRSERWIYAAKLGGTMLVVSAFTAYLLYEAKTGVHRANFNWTMEIVKGTLIGSLIGYFVPYWFRLNLLKSPMQSLQSFIDFYRDDISRETLVLKRGDLERATVLSGLAVARAGGAIDPLEIQVTKDLLYRLGTAIEDFSEEIGNQVLTKLLTEDLSPQSVADELQELLAPLRKAPHLTQILVYFTEAIALADGVVDKEEKLMLGQVSGMLQSTQEQAGPMHSLAIGM